VADKADVALALAWAFTRLMTGRTIKELYQRVVEQPSGASLKPAVCSQRTASSKQRLKLNSGVVWWCALAGLSE